MIFTYLMGISRHTLEYFYYTMAHSHMVGETMTDRWGNPDNLQVVSIQISRSGILHWFHTDIYQDMSYSTSQNKIYTEHFEILTSCSSISSSLWHCYSPAWDRRCWRNSDGLFHYKVWRGGKFKQNISTKFHAYIWISFLTILTYRCAHHTD